MNLSFNEFEMTVVRMAAEREGMSAGAWAARAAVLVAKEQLVPVSADARFVIQELVRSRVELSRIRAEFGAVTPGADPGSSDSLAADFAAAATAATKRLDAATRQLMRERVERS
ncbi:hypothetical protein ACGFX4_09165 [Kitasatospora sp. NPDC048365]|uniref:hypothetical protein n=1 Tax=Kitasatospora sp. NPDC048365 TaxID=3364050 RepID=UPI003713EB22